jgi:hypothetical protein
LSGGKGVVYRCHAAHSLTNHMVPIPTFLLLTLVICLTITLVHLQSLVAPPPPPSHPPTQEEPFASIAPLNCSNQAGVFRYLEHMLSHHAAAAGVAMPNIDMSRGEGGQGGREGGARVNQHEGGAVTRRGREGATGEGGRG